MPNYTLSPNMSLPVPNVGTETGPQYATDVNNSLNLIDQHNHSAGSGVQITPSGLNINADLTMGGNNLTNIRSLRLSSQGSPITASGLDLGILYESGVDLYYNDGAGNQIRLTQSGSVAGSSGTITGLPSGTASASYSSPTFTFQSATATPANLSGGSIILGNINTSGNTLTLSPPSLSSSYQLFLPTIALVPGDTGFLTLDSSGNMLVGVSTNHGITNANIAPGTITSTQIANSTITDTQIASATITGGKIAAGTITNTNIASGTIVSGNIAAGTITGSNIAATTITNANIAPATITHGEIANGTILSGNLSSNINLPGSQAGAGGNVIVTATKGAINNPGLVAGGWRGSATLQIGCTIAHSGTGLYTVTFSPSSPFAGGQYAVVVTLNAILSPGTNLTASTDVLNSNSFVIKIGDGATLQDQDFSFIVVGSL